VACGESADGETSFQVGVGAGFLDTSLDFDGGRRAEVEMTTFAASFARALRPRVTLLLSAGVVFDGEIRPEGRPAHDVDPGAALAAGVEYRQRAGDGWKPAVDFTAVLGATWARTRDPRGCGRASYLATDARVGVRAAWTVADAVSPYAVSRVFGGPVFWELDDDNSVASDIHHYQVAVGMAVSLGRIGLFGEWASLGERAVSAGATMVW